MKYQIRDWTNKICFNDVRFDFFEDAWSFIYENDPNVNDDEHWYDDYYVVEVSNETI